MKRLDLKSGALCAHVNISAGHINGDKPGIALSLLAAKTADEPVAFVIMSRVQAYAVINAMMNAIDELDAATLKERAS